MIWTREPRTASPPATTARRSAATVSRLWPARPAPTPVPLAALSVRRSAGCAPTRSPATVRSPSSSASCARTSPTGVRRNAARTTWRSASAAPSPAVAAPRLAARWPVDQQEQITDTQVGDLGAGRGGGLAGPTGKVPEVRHELGAEVLTDLVRGQ